MSIYDDPVFRRRSQIESPLSSSFVSCPADLPTPMFGRSVGTRVPLPSHARVY